MRVAEDISKPEGMLDCVKGKGAAEDERRRPEQSIAIFHGSQCIEELHAAGRRAEDDRPVGGRVVTACSGVIEPSGA